MLPVRRKTLPNQSINQSTEAFWANFNQRLKTEVDFKFVQRKDHAVDQKQIITRMCKLNATFF